MPKLKVGGTVWHGEPPVEYFIVEFDQTAKTATIKSTPRPRVAVIHHNVKLSELTILDSGQSRRAKAKS
jgi:hypothetical protein